MYSKIWITLTNTPTLGDWHLTSAPPPEQRMTNFFHPFSRGPRPRMGFATSVLAGSGSTRHGLPPQAKNPSYAPVNLNIVDI